MTDEKIERIKALDEPHRSKLVILYKAVVENWARCKEDRSAAALKNAQFADAAFESYWNKVFADEPQELQPSERFSSRKVALSWLASQGVQISQGKFYQDCKAGKVLVYPDKTVSRASVAQYLINMQRSSPVFDPNNADLAMREQLLKVRKLDLEVAKLERQDRSEDARWMLREDSWALLVGVLHLLRQNLDYHVHRIAAEIAVAAEGRAETAPQLIDHILSGIVNPSFNDLAGRSLEHACFAGMPQDSGGNEHE